MHESQRLTVFAGATRLASGDRALVLRAINDAADTGDSPVLVFDDATGAQIDLDPRISGESLHVDDRRTPGRPRLGVVGREVTLLPRHWEWLSSQPGGASAALRRLVDQARRDNADTDRIRQSQEAAFRFMSAIAGNEPGFEEACRALFAGDAGAFEANTGAWPRDVFDYARNLASDALGGQLS